MQVVEKSGEGLSKVFGVTVPAADLSERLEARIAEITPKLTLKGFRPGKVPPAHIRRIHGKALMAEVIEETVKESRQKLVDEQKIRLATEPDLKPESDMDKVLAGGEDLAFELAIEIMPDFEPLDVSKLKLTRPIYEPTKKEVDDALADLAKQARAYKARTAKTAKAKDGDQVLMNFVGKLDGEPFEGGSAEDHELVLGSGQFIPGFEEQLVGAKPGEDKTIKVTFPAEYQAAHLAGKEVEFDVKVKEVREPVDSEPDDELAKRVGLSDLAALREALTKNLSDQYARNSRFKLKRALLDELDTGHDFPLPGRMVEAEFEGIWRQVEQDKEKGELPEEDAKKSDKALKTEYRKIAERRVRLGLVLAEIGRRANIQISDQDMAQALQREAMQYGEQAQQVFEMLRNNPQMQEQIRAPLYEDKVVELIFDQAQITDKKVSKKVIEAEDDLPEGY